MNRNTIHDVFKKKNTKSLYSIKNYKYQKNIDKDYNTIRIRSNINSNKQLIGQFKNVRKYVYKSPIQDINNVDSRLNVLETQLKKEQIKNQKYSEVYKKLLKCTDEIFKTKPAIKNDTSNISAQITPYEQSVIKSSIYDTMVMLDKKRRKIPKIELLFDNKYIVTESPLLYKGDDTKDVSAIHKKIIMSRLPFIVYECETKHRLPRIRKHGVLKYEYKKKILIDKIIKYIEINKSKIYTDHKINKNIHTILVRIHKELIDIKEIDTNHFIIDKYYDMNTMDELKQLFIDLGLKKKSCISPLYRFFS